MRAATAASAFGHDAEREEKERAASLLNLWGAATIATIGAVTFAASKAAVTAVNKTAVRTEGVTEFTSFMGATVMVVQTWLGEPSFPQWKGEGKRIYCIHGRNS